MSRSTPRSRLLRSGRPTSCIDGCDLATRRSASVAASSSRTPILIEPPHDIAPAVQPRQTRVAADRDRDLPTGALDLLGKLQAGSRSPNDKHATVRQFPRIAIGRRRHLTDRCRQASRHIRNQRLVAMPSGDDHAWRAPHTAIALDPIATRHVADGLHGGTRDDRRRGSTRGTARERPQTPASS